MSFGNFMYPRVSEVHVTSKVPGKCSVGCMCNVKNMGLESLNAPFPCLNYIPNDAETAFQAFNEIVTLTCSIPYDVLSFVIMYVSDYP